jgi:hypothetical protein
MARTGSTTTRKSGVTKAVLLLVAAVLLVQVSFVQRRLNKEREVLGLTRLAPIENAPPVLTFTTVALGGFRGLIANVLWIRLNDLQEQDKYFEMVQLADWITKLQPHFVTVWIHLAWNMSYNISVKFNDPHDRWMWVQRGIELLRDDALRWNPGEPLLYRELAWHFQHKMGHNLDDAHHYYKIMWAKEMHGVFGGGRPNFDELITPKSDDAKARSELLRAKYKMDPTWMKEVDDAYGPLEWRLPESHAIYWAYLGLAKTKHDNLKAKDLITLRRVIFQSMQLAFHRGRLIIPTGDLQNATYGPNLEIVARAHQTYEQMMKDEPEMLRNIQTAHRNFLKTAVEYLYTHNRNTQAKEWFAFIKEKYPESLPPNQSLDDFALERVTEIVSETSHDKTQMVLEGLLTSAFYYLALGEDDVAINYDRFAERVRARYQQQIGEKSTNRVGLRPLSVLKQDVLNRMLDPQSGLDPLIPAQLRTKLNLPAPEAAPTAPQPPATNEAPATPAKPRT